MCAFICDGSCQGGGSGIPGPFAVAGWLLSRVVAPLGVATAIFGYRWLSGAPLRKGYRGRRLITRPVRAVGQLAVTAVAIGLLLNWVVTVIVVAGSGMALGAVAAGTRVAPRLRELQQSRPRRVAVTVGEPIHHEPINARKI